MSLINGLSSAAYAAGDYYSKGALADSAAKHAKDLATYQAELQQQRDLRLEEAKNAPLNRISAMAQAKMGEEVPLEAAPVTAVSGTNEQGDKFGFKGDIDKMRSSINALPDGEDKTKAMAQLDQQVAQDTARAKSLVNGKTRKRTADEALAAAVEQAKTSDLPALAAYESQIGRPARDERRVANTEQKNDAQIEFQNRRLDQQVQFQKDDAEIRNRLAAAAEARAGRADSRASMQMDKAELQSTRQSLTSVLTDIGKQQDRIEGLMATAMDPEQQAVYRKQLAKLDASREVARGRLNELAGVDVTSAKEPNPAEDGVRYDAQGVAYVRGPDGKPVRRDAQSATTGSTPAPKAKADDAAAPTSSSKPQPQAPTSALDKMQAKNLDALRVMAQQVAQAEAQLAAVAKSGDAKSAVSYANNLQALRDRLQANAEEHFGNGAQAAIARVSKSQ